MHVHTSVAECLLRFSSSFDIQSCRQGAKNNSPVHALAAVLVATTIHRNITATEKIVLRTLKKRDGSSVANVAVATVYTPSGKVNPLWY